MANQDNTHLKEAGQDINTDSVAQEHHNDLVTEVQKAVELLNAVNELAGIETRSRADELALTIRGIAATQAFDTQMKVVAALVGMDYNALGG
jgi:hypothetical protein